MPGKKILKIFFGLSRLLRTPAIRAWIRVARCQNPRHGKSRRPRADNFLKTAGAALTISIFTGNIRGANDRVTAGFIGMGRMGMSNLEYAMQQPDLYVPAVCDVYQSHLKAAAHKAASRGHRARALADFRDVLNDRSIELSTSQSRRNRSRRTRPAPTRRSRTSLKPRRK